MVDDRVTDGRRIAQLLASEVRGHERGPAGRLSVADAREAEGSLDGDFAYGIDHGSDGRIAEVYVHPDRARVEFSAGQDAAVEAARDADLRVRPKAVEPPRTLVFVESGVEAKRALDVLRAVAEALDEGG